MQVKRRWIGLGAALAITAGGVVTAINVMEPPRAEAEAPEADSDEAIGTVCGEINGFTVTAISEFADCEAALAMSSAYTVLLLDPDARADLGTGLFWSSEGWVCSRNYDSTGVTANSHGLFCQRGNTKVSLVS